MMQGQLAVSKPVGFVGGLFDLPFTTLVTTRIIKVLCVLYLAAVVLMFAAGEISGAIMIVQGNAPDADNVSPLREGAERAAIAMGILQIVLTPVVALAAVIYGRVLFECVAVFFRAAEHLGDINRKTREPG